MSGTWFACYFVCFYLFFTHVLHFNYQDIYQLTTHHHKWFNIGLVYKTLFLATHQPPINTLITHQHFIDTTFLTTHVADVNIFFTCITLKRTKHKNYQNIYQHFHHASTHIVLSTHILPNQNNPTLIIHQLCWQQINNLQNTKTLFYQITSHHNHQPTPTINLINHHHHPPQSPIYKYI